MALSTMQTLSYEDLSDGIGQLKLNRPDKLNAQNPLMWQELPVAIQELGSRADLRCVIVTGEGSSFSAGFDASAMADLAAAQAGPASTREPASGPAAWADGFVALARSPFATIASIRGYAVGAGLELALACDLRIVTRTARLQLPGLKYGIVPDTGAAFWLPRLVGIGRARELLLSGRRFDGVEAERIGLAEQVVADADLDSATRALAEMISSNGRFGITAVKQVLTAALELPFAEALSAAQGIQASCYSSDAFVHAAAEFGSRMHSPR